jgi:hypothetical protein
MRNRHFRVQTHSISTKADYLSSNYSEILLKRVISMSQPKSQMCDFILNVIEG